MSLLPVVLAALICCYYAYHNLVAKPWHNQNQNQNQSSWQKIPAAHWSARFSSLWILYVRYSSREIRTIHEAHAKYGPVVRLSPAEVSVNCVEGGVKIIYGGGFDKHDWY